VRKLSPCARTRQFETLSRPAGDDLCSSYLIIFFGNSNAQEVGKLATLEVRLNLSAKQKPLFEKWKTVKLAAAKARAKACGERKPPEPFTATMKASDAVACLKADESHLEDRLGEIRTELPALAALAVSLDEEQKAALMPMGMGPDHPWGRPKGRRTAVLRPVPACRRRKNTPSC
jgi:hypothetical protein